MRKKILHSLHIPRVCLSVLWVLTTSSGLSSSSGFALSPGGAATLSLVPGLGEVVEGNVWTGIGYFTSTIGLILFPGKTEFAQVARGAGISLYSYQMYDAYRDAHPQNHMYGTGTLLQNYLAAVNPVNAWDPFSVGFVGLGATQVRKIRRQYGDEPYKLYRLAYFATAVQQEEALYRGFLYPFFTDIYGGSKFFAALTTSAIDAFQHYFYLGPTALEPTVFTMRTALFMLLTWQFTRNNYELAPGVFAHAWFDYLQGAGATPNSVSKTSASQNGLSFQFGIRY